MSLDPTAEPLPDERPIVRVVRIGQHLAAVALATVGLVRALLTGAYPLAAVLVAMAVLAWYFVAMLSIDRLMRGANRMLWWLILAALWALACAISPEFVWLAFLLWLVAGYLLPMGFAVVASALVYAVTIIAPLAHHGQLHSASILGPLIGGAFAFGVARGYLQLVRDGQEREHLIASLTRAQQERTNLQDELALAQRQAGATLERTRLAGDIHDTIAQGLSSIKLLANAGSGSTRDPEAAELLDRVEQLAGESLRDVRRIVAELAPAELEDAPLAAALQAIVGRLGEQTGIRAELHVDEGLPQLPLAAEVALLRAAQSALANARQHADATRVVVSLVHAEQVVRVDVVDDGRGFDVRALELQHRPNRIESGYGLRLMRSRLAELGGGLEIESAPGEGTTLSAHVPKTLKKARR